MSDGPGSSCIYKSKYDVAIYRENAPHLSYAEKIDLIKKVFVPEKNFCFPETTRSFKYEWLLMFPCLFYSPSEDASCCLSCVMISLLKLLGLKIYFHSPSELGQVLFLTLKLIVKAKSRKLILHMNLFKAFIFQHDLNLKLFFLQIKDASHEISLLCDRKYKHEVEENRTVLVPIIDTIVTLGMLGLPFCCLRDDSKYHPKAGEYSTGGVCNFVEFLQFRVRGGDKVLEQHIKTCSKNASYNSKTSQNDLISCCGQSITELVVRKIKENRFFSILADEASDCSNQEQLPLVI